MILSPSQDPNLSLDERLKVLYPMVDESNGQILPRSWSTHDKFNYTGLSQNNLRVHYKGHGKNHKDASSVRATHSIPSACGIYYYEVKIVSKGRDGYMGIGLSVQGVNMNRLPGWDKHSYGYHGDDGHSFCSSGTGQPYGPTFTTGDVIGCALNLVTNTCFYTKNGHNLGVAFTDLAPNLYPTVGLQTPGEMIDANFGQLPFVFDIESEMAEERRKVRLSIDSIPIPPDHTSLAQWKSLRNKLIAGYLVHHGYTDTAQAFAKSTGYKIKEDLQSVKNRRWIRSHILKGEISKAVALISKLYPKLFSRDRQLHFLLKVRQFIEVVVGCDTLDDDIHTEENKSTNGHCNTDKNVRNTTPNERNGNQDSISSVKDEETTANSISTATTASESCDSLMEMDVDDGLNGGSIDGSGELADLTSYQLDKVIKFGQSLQSMLTEMSESNNNIENNNVSNGGNGSVKIETKPENLSMESESKNVRVDDEEDSEMLQTTGTTFLSATTQEGKREDDNSNAKCESPTETENSVTTPTTVNKQNDENDKQIQECHKILQDAFALLAYTQPHASPAVSWQLQQSQRESLSCKVNSAILKLSGLPTRPLLQDVADLTNSALTVMAKQYGIASAAFSPIQQFFINSSSNKPPGPNSVS